MRCIYAFHIRLISYQTLYCCNRKRSATSLVCKERCHLVNVELAVASLVVESVMPAIDVVFGEYSVMVHAP